MENAGYVPEYFTVNDYRQRMAAYNLVGGTVVSGSFQGFDQGYLLAALKQLGPSFAGVTQLPATATDEEIIRLHDQGVRGVRFNLKRGGAEDVKHLASLAARVDEIAGWHVELYVDYSDLLELHAILITLPKASIDHLGLTGAGFDTLLRLVEQGIYVKASGFGRVDFDVAQALKTIHNINPAALMFGTDLPSTRAPRPFRHEDVELIVNTLGEKDARRVLHDNAVNFYSVPSGRPST